MGAVLTVSDLIIPSTETVREVDDRIMLVMPKHSLVFVSLVAVYATIEVTEAEKTEMYYTQSISVLDHCLLKCTLYSFA